VLLADTRYADDAIARTDEWVTKEEALIANRGPCKPQPEVAHNS
jgi:hypothetical protein